MANKKGPRTLGYTNVRLQAVLPTAIDKFHLALDELEYDIVSCTILFVQKEKKHVLNSSRYAQRQS